MWTTAALVVTVLMGGLIAYFGDLIGRRFGKRRASLFGLRPRHTAVLITSVTGVLISLGTTVVLFLVVQPVRRVILEGEAAIRSSARLRRENTALHERTLRLQQEARRADAQRRHALEQRQLAIEARAIAERQLASAQQARDQAMEGMRRAQRERLAAEAEARRARELARSERAAAAELAQRNETLRRESEELRKLSDELNRRNEQLRADNATLASANTAYSQENAAIAQQNEALVRERDQLSITVADLREQQAKLLIQTEQLRDQYTDLMQSYATAYGAHRSLWEMFEALRTQRVAIHAGEELGRIVIPPNTPPEGVREAIQKLLSIAHAEALKKGATPSERARAVEIVDKRFTTPTQSGVTTIRITEQDRIDAIVTRLARASEPTCLLAVAVTNSVVGEPGGIDLQPLPNPLVYRKGQVVGTRKVDARRPAGVVFDELVLMLKGIGQSALGRGLIPRTDPVTGEPQVGALTASQLVDLTSRLRATHSSVEVIALAKSDVHAADELSLEFRLRRGQ